MGLLHIQVIVHYVVYLALLYLGIYFINASNIIQKFKQHRTNFAEYGEEISELPSIVAFTEYSRPDNALEYGKDFNLTYQSIESWEKELVGTNLTKGFNFLDNGLEIEVLDLLAPLVNNNRTSVFTYYHNFKITPYGFVPGASLGYILTFVFESTSGFEDVLSKTGMVLTTENNTWCNTGQGYMDGDITIGTRQFGRTGEMNYLEIAPEKYVYRSIHGDCRDRPYNQIAAEKISEGVSNKCSKPCRPLDWYCKFGVLLDNFQVCKTKHELECFENVKRSAFKDIPHKPCTKLQYKSSKATWLINYKNQAAFRMYFLNPPKVMVKEEYLIYDFLAMFGEIGGTMGICIGFSFNDFFKWIWSLGQTLLSNASPITKILAKVL